MKPCKVWGGYRNNKGYGVSSSGGKRVYVHRLEWQRANGSIPAGMCVCHRCDNPACYEITHLFLGSKADNSRDMVAKSRSASGERHSQVKLTAAQVRDMRRAYALGGTTQAALCRQYRVSSAHVCNILKGKYWANLPATPSERAGRERQATLRTAK